MKDFHVAPVDHQDAECSNPNMGESALERFRRVSKLVASKSANIKWNEVIKGASSEAYSQIGRCRNRQSFKNQQNLMKAMEQARRLIEQGPMSPTPCHSPNLGYVDETSRTLVELLKNISEEINEISPQNTLRVKTPNRATSPLHSLNAQLQTLISKTPSPYQTSIKPKVTSINLRSISADGTLSPPPKPQSNLKNRSPTPDSFNSLDIPVIEIEHHQADVNDESENAPLKQSPASPVKVIKRKAPRIAEDISVSRPSVSKVSGVQGMIPPPPGKDDVKPLQIPVLSTTPATPLLPMKPSMKLSETFFDSNESSPTNSGKEIISQPLKEILSQLPKEVPSQSPIEILSQPLKEAPPQTPREESNYKEPSSPVMIAVSSPTSCSSTEKLVINEAVENKPATSPICLRPQNKIEDVKTIKRQAKTGWL